MSGFNFEQAASEEGNYVVLALLNVETCERSVDLRHLKTVIAIPRPNTEVVATKFDVKVKMEIVQDPDSHLVENGKLAGQYWSINQEEETST